VFLSLKIVICFPAYTNENKDQFNLFKSTGFGKDGNSAIVASLLQIFESSKFNIKMMPLVSGVLMSTVKQSK